MKIYPIVIAICSITVFLSVNASAQAPTQEWSRVITGSQPSGRTSFLGTFDSGGVNGGGTCNGFNSQAKYEWDTNRIWIAYTDGTSSESGGAKSDGIIAQLLISSGGISGASTTSAAYNVAACGIAPDMRGRVYTQLGPCDATNSVPNLIYRTSNFTALANFSQTQICSSTSGTHSLRGVYANVAPNRDSNATRVFFASTSSGGGIRGYHKESNFDPAVYDDVCSNSNAGAAVNGVAFREDDLVAQDFVYTIDSGNLIRIAAWGTCSITTQTAAADAPGPACVTFNATASFVTLDCIEKDNSNPDRFLIYKHDLTDTTVAVARNTTINAAAALTPDHSDDGLTPSLVSIAGAIADASGDYFVCGSAQKSQTDPTQHSFIAKFNNGFTNQAWNITISDSTFRTVGCDLNSDGRLLWYGHSVSGGAAINLQLIQYCCNDVGAANSQFSYEGIGVPPAPTSTPSLDLDSISRSFRIGLGLSEFGANLFLGVLMISACTVGTAGMPQFRAFRGVAALAGALVGVLVSWALEWLTDGTVFFLSVVAVLLIGFGFMLRR